ncbi:MAG: 2-succinyl-5-enolpyruvyl-6-hydroxy-3-cyclohexene-1-carboxylic-acid synthase [Gemmatimonadaceae bacterium]
MSSNIQAASDVLSAAVRAGVRDVCLCAGSRNSPLVAVAAAATGIRPLAFPDERAAAFFALGRARSTGRPVAVITTSGTAVAEMLPAAIEAHYTGTPLLLVTADRPRRFRGTGAPQTIEQPGLFGVYCERSIDMQAGDPVDISGWGQRSPLHLNVAFDEPLLDDKIPHLDFAGAPETLAKQPAAEPASAEIDMLREFLDAHTQPLVILGQLDPVDRQPVLHFLRALGAPVHAEALSGLREHDGLRDIRITGGERMLASGAFNGVLRIGGVPTLRFWRDLEARDARLPVLSVTSLPFAGLSRGDIIVRAPRHLLPRVDPKTRRMERFLQEDRAMCERVDAILRDEPLAELSMIRGLSAMPADGAHVFLGNSLPIREWDLAATRHPREYDYSANRGANGIDGALSTFFGMAREGKENWAVVGDLTLLYDLSAPWIIPQLDPEVSLRLVVVNNGGGRIFGRVAALDSVDTGSREKFFENGHEVSFGSWADMWRIPYQRWEAVPQTVALPPRCVIEIVPDPAASARLWRRFDSLWSSP